MPSALRGQPAHAQYPDDGKLLGQITQSIPHEAWYSVPCRYVLILGGVDGSPGVYQQYSIESVRMISLFEISHFLPFVSLYKSNLYRTHSHSTSGGVGLMIHVFLLLGGGNPTSFYSGEIKQTNIVN